VNAREIAEIADELVAAYTSASILAPITAARPAFDVADAYAVLAEIETRRCREGWQPAGRKIGFTNRTIWPRYGVYQPMWARIWTHTVHHATEGRASLAIARFVQPRLEPEVVFKLRRPIPLTDDARAVLRCVEWVAAGFEIVQSHFVDWKFKAPDCTAAFGLHGALIVGTPLPVTDANCDFIAAQLPKFVATLARDNVVIDRGIGANVLDSPALALVHLARVLIGQPQAPVLAANEIVTTGTLTDAWPIARGETWTSDYGALGLEGLELRIE